EFHSEGFSRTGGTLEMVQLWVNLRAQDKMTPARYQTLLQSQIPVVPMAGGSRLRLIAGEFAGQRGAAQTFSPIDVWDMHLTRDAAITLPLMEGRSVALVVLRGTLKVNGEQP